MQPRRRSCRPSRGPRTCCSRARGSRRRCPSRWRGSRSRVSGGAAVDAVGDEQRLADADHHVVGRVGRRAVVVLDDPRADAGRRPQSLLSAQTEEQKVRLLPPATLEVAVVAGAAQALRGVPCRRPDRLACRPSTCRPSARSASRRRRTPAPRGRRSPRVQGVRGDLRRRRAHPDLRLRAVGRLRRRVLQAARRGRAVGVVAAHRGAEELGGEVGAGDAERVVRAAHPRRRTGRAGAPKASAPAVGAHAGQLEGVAGGDRRADHADVAAVADRIGPRLAVPGRVGSSAFSVCSVPQKLIGQTPPPMASAGQ